MDEKQQFLPSLAGWYGPTEPGAEVRVMVGARPRILETKPLLVGEWPPKTGEGPYGPLSARPARVLSAILGITYETFLCMFDRVNLLKWWAGEKPPGVPALRAIASGFTLNDGCPIILLGRRVCQAFGFTSGYYYWSDFGQKPCVAIPHPSGLNRLYNHVTTRTQVQDVLHRALLYHGKVFRVGDYPHGQGSLIMIQRGKVWGDAASRLKHRSDKHGREHLEG